MSGPADLLADVPAPAAYAVLAGALLAESILFLGAFVPTLTLMLGAGALARAGRLDLPVVLMVAAASVVVGDFFSYRAGRLLGARLPTTRVGRRVPAAAWRRAEEMMARRGGQAMLVARFIPVLRTLVPYLAGGTRQRYRRIAPYSVAAAAAWACVEAGGGYAAAAVLRQVFALGVPAVAGAAVVTAVGVWWVRRRGRANRRPMADDHIPFVG